MSSVTPTRKLVVSDGEVQRELLFVGRMCVGRAPECEISANDPKLSRNHAEFVEEDGVARVRDLKSRNGLTLNGEKVTDAVLAPGDHVVIAGLSIRYVEEQPLPTVIGMSAADYQPTEVIGAPGGRPGAPAGAPPPPVHAEPAAPLPPELSASVEPSAPAASPDEERTRFMAPPVFAPAAPAAGGGASHGSAEPGAQPAGMPAGAAGSGHVGAGAAPPPGTGNDDATRAIPMPNFGRPSGAGAPAAPAAGSPARSAPSHNAPPNASASSAPLSPRVAAAAAAGAAAAANATPAVATPIARGSRGKAVDDGVSPVVRPSARGFTWPGRLIIRSLLLGIAVWAIASLPQVSLLKRVIASNDSARARAVAMWLAADAARAIESGVGVSNAADGVLAYPGVEAAVIIDSRTGAVLAPGRRGTETIKTIRDLKVAPADVMTLRGVVINDRVEIATPVLTRDGRRSAVAWVTFRQRPPPEAANVGPVMAMSLLCALAVSLLTAALIRRTTLAAMTRLRDDVELAISGRLDAVGDPLGAKPMREAVDVINYLVTRYRAIPSTRGQAGSGGPATEPAAGQPQTAAGTSNIAQHGNAGQGAQGGRGGGQAPAGSAAGAKPGAGASARVIDVAQPLDAESGAD